MTHPPTPSQLSPNRAERVDLPAGIRTLAALRAPGRGTFDGASVLLVPGYTGSKEDFAPLIDPLAEDGHEVLAVDLPGQYETPGPDDEDTYLPAGLGTTIARATESLAEAGRRVVLLGHSYGGLVARAAVLTGAPVSGLVLLDTGPEHLPPGDRLSALQQGEPLLRSQGIEAAQQLREAYDVTKARQADGSPALRAFLRRRFLASSPTALLGMATGLREEPNRVAMLSAELRRRDVPCLVACGESDDAWSAATQQDMAARLGARFTAIPDSAHSPNTENPAALLAALLPVLASWDGR